MRRTIGLLLLLSLAEAAMAAKPSLVVEGDDGKVALALSELAVRATIRGHLARTEFELTFHNALDHVTGGEFVFPLPPDAEVSDLGLWFDGKVRHGVAVERVLARTAYEETVHASVDPALAEWSVGRAFRFSVYPIPAKGEKKVLIAYDQELTKNDYELDLRYASAIEHDVTIDADGRTMHPRVDDVIRIARDTSESAFVVHANEDGFWYASAAVDFHANDRRTPPAARVVILYDASSSAVQQNAALVRAFLTKFLEKQQSWAAADVIPFHIDLDAPHRIERAGMSAGARDLERFLDDTPLLGATNLIAVAQNLPRIAASLPPGSRIVLVTDGLTSLGDSRDVAAAFMRLADLGKPLLVVNASTNADDRLLDNIARVTGGWSVDLTRVTPEAAVDVAMNLPTIADIDGSEVVPRRVSFSGNDRLHLAMRARESITKFRDVPLRELHGAAEVSMVRRAWARAKLSELLANGASDAELIAHGTVFTQLTPRTSLLVLERWWDYERYKIPLPPDLAEQKARDEKNEREAAEHSPSPLPPPVFHTDGWTVTGHVVEETGAPLPGVTVELYDGDTGICAAVTDANGGFVLGAASAPKEPVLMGWLSGLLPVARDVTGHDVNLTMKVGAVTETITVTAEAPRLVETTAVSAQTSLRTNINVTDQLLNTIAAEQTTADDPDTLAEVAQHRRELTRGVVDRLRSIGSTSERLRYYLSARSLLGGDKGFHVFAAEAIRERSPEIAARILSDLAEARPEDAPLLRILARVLDGWGEENLARMLLMRAIEIAPIEPQSWREMILLEAKHGHPYAVASWAKRMPATEDWKFDDVYVQTKAAIERFHQHGGDVRMDDGDDLMIELMWDTGWSWVDIHIVEPSGEIVKWDHVASAAGARFTGGYTFGFGPEMYAIRNAPRGTYRVEIDYYMDDATNVSAETLAHVVVHKRTRGGVETKEHFTVLSQDKEHRLLTTVDM